ncbi:MAG: hypothetical protein JST54_32280 [Deltaproteobacteria bacterium]|nr:hypothetical protein [Deltaproteobacteria bacterium]
MMMIKQIILGRVLPLGAAGFFLHSSASPIKPALAAFEAASSALAGESADHTDANFPGAVQPQVDAIPTPDKVKKSFSSAISNIFSGGNKTQAQAQLDGIINDVKYHGHPPDPGPTPQPSPQQNAQQPARATKGKSEGPEVKLTKAGKHQGG